MCWYSIYCYADKNRKRPRTAEVRTIAEALYLVAVVLYVLKGSFDTTLFQLTWPLYYEAAIRLLLCLVVLLRTGDARVYKGKGWLLCALSFVIFKLSWCSTGYSFLADTALLVIGAAGVPYKKVLKAGFWTSLYVFLLAIIGSFTDCIADLVYLDGAIFKHSFGIVYPTDFAAHVVFLFLTGWILYGKAQPFVTFICPLVFSGFVYYFSGARCSTIILFLSAVGILYTFWAEKGRERFLLHHCIPRCVDALLTYATPLCALLMIVLTSLYISGSEAIAYLNQILSNRLSLAQAAIEKYGITLFGTPFIQRGFGGSTAWSWALDYTFIDSSYMLVLLRYGLMVLLVICLLSVLTGKRALKYGHREVVLAVALVAAHSSIEHHLLEAAYNFFFILPFTDFSYVEAREQEAILTSDRKRASYIIGLGIGITMLVLLVSLPRFGTYMKSIVDILHLDEPQNHLSFIVIITACMVWLFLFTRLIYKSVFMLAQRVALPKRTFFFCIAILLVTLCCSFVKGEQIIRQAQIEYQPLVEADAPIIEALLSKEEVGKLYVGYVPELYRRKYSDISDTVLSGDGLAGRENVTLITKDEEELWVLMSVGYEYGELPSGHAVYTCNSEAKALLEAAGVRMTPYYSRQRSVSLWDVSIWNGLSMTDGWGVLLSGPEQSLLHGPGVTVCRGTLQVRYVMRLINNTATTDAVATAKLTSDWGLHVWKQQEIYAADFDTNGEYTCVIERKIGYNCPNMEFTISVVDGVELEVQEISYGKVG